MMVNINIEIKNRIDSVWLWDAIKKYGVNLLDAGEKAFVYGTADLEDAMVVCYICCMFGPVRVEISKAK